MLHNFTAVSGEVVSKNTRNGIITAYRHIAIVFNTLRSSLIPNTRNPTPCPNRVPPFVFPRYVSSSSTRSCVVVSDADPLASFKSSINRSHSVDTAAGMDATSNGTSMLRQMFTAASVCCCLTSGIFPTADASPATTAAPTDGPHAARAGIVYRARSTAGSRIYIRHSESEMLRCMPIVWTFNRRSDTALLASSAATCNVMNHARKHALTIGIHGAAAISRGSFRHNSATGPVLS